MTRTSSVHKAQHNRHQLQMKYSFNKKSGTHMSIAVLTQHFNENKKAEYMTYSAVIRFKTSHN